MNRNGETATEDGQIVGGMRPESGEEKKTKGSKGGGKGQNAQKVRRLAGKADAQRKFRQGLTYEGVNDGDSASGKNS